MRDSPDVTNTGGGELSGLSLPGDKDAWKDCQLGPVSKWPNQLQAYIPTILALTYPAAIFWGEEYVLIHNEAWDSAGGIHAQGQAQRDRLSSETLEILRSVTERQIPKEVQSDDLLREDADASKESSTTILSPLMVAGDVRSKAIMVQLLPKPMLYQSLQLAGGHQGTIADHTAAMGTQNVGSKDDIKNADSVPIDEHPFFRRFAEMLPSGLAILDHNAQAVFVNQHFYDLTTLKEEDRSFATWPQSIHPDDYERVMHAYKDAFRSQKQLRTEFRARGQPYPWRLLLLTPLGDESLQHVSLREYGGFICSIVDISSEKSAELSERKAAKQAQERKEQQERFIDMISHEIRNPLSAVLHCAEDIEDAIRDHEDGNSVNVGAVREAVETINLCCSHQKNIVDDVLSFSKLDASLLSLVPKPSQPSRQLSKTLGMFKHEFTKQKMEFRFNVDDTYHGAGVDWVMADVARVSQVLINLITNAIKFTNHAEGEKIIDCRVAASVERPKSYPPNVVFFQPDSLAHKMDATNSAEWGNGDTLYVMVAVIDTGIGISKTGQQKLFERFQQATPKTADVYGGSGLGLNISRKICHLHGGEIGVSSEEGQGSTFGFFFKVKRTDAQQEDDSETSDQDSEGKLRNKIEAISKESPSDMDPKEPFEWSPDGKDKKSQANSRGSNSQPRITPLHGNDDDDNDQNSSKEQTQQKRPSLAKQQRTSEKLVSKDVITSPVEDGDSKRPIARSPRDGFRAHVLLVEDNIINQKIVFRKLEAKGFNVTTSNNGQEAVDAVREAPKPSSGDKAAFDVILMDQVFRAPPIFIHALTSAKEMPIMDGNAATRAIRELEKNGEVEHIPIIGVSANVRGAQQDEMINSGMNEVLSKPYKIEDLVAKINAVLGIESEIQS